MAVVNGEQAFPSWANRAVAPYVTIVKVEAPRTTYAEGRYDRGDPIVRLESPSPELGTIPGTRAEARYTPISFTCENGAETPFSLWFKFGNDDQAVLVFDSAEGFSALFQHAQSLWDVGSQRVTILQLGGWQADITAVYVGGQGEPDTGVLSWALPV